jgi:hypothetical protein
MLHWHADLEIKACTNNLKLKICQHNENKWMENGSWAKNSAKEVYRALDAIQHEVGSMNSAVSFTCLWHLPSLSGFRNKAICRVFCSLIEHLVFCRKYTEGGRRAFLRNVGTFVPQYMASQNTPDHRKLFNHNQDRWICHLTPFFLELTYLVFELPVSKLHLKASLTFLST